MCSDSSRTTDDNRSLFRLGGRLGLFGPYGRGPGVTCFNAGGGTDPRVAKIRATVDSALPCALRLARAELVCDAHERDAPEGVGPDATGSKPMFRTLTRLLSLALVALTLPLAVEAKTLYWISHGSPADPVWTYFLAGANMWAKDTGQTVKTSFHYSDMPSQQEAIRAAIAAKADAIVTTSPDPGSLVEVVKEARAAGIPVINFNTPDPKRNFNAYVGGDLGIVGKGLGEHLVDHGLVKSGDFVGMPVEVPGASYGVEEEKGIATVFKPLNITWEVTDSGLDQATIISRMSDYLTANRKKIKAIIGLGDGVTGSIKRVFDQVAVKPGETPVVGWGNSRDTTDEVMSGYVSAGQWQDPQATSYLALSLANMAGASTGYRPVSTSTTARFIARTPRQSTTRLCRASRRAAPSPARRVLAAKPCIGSRALSFPTAQSSCATTSPGFSAPEFGPLVLLAVEPLAVFYAINPNWGS